MNKYHEPVMLDESIDALNVTHNGIYVDATFGGGGHSKKILEKLKKGKLYAFDKDGDSNKNFLKDDRFKLFISDYKNAFWIKYDQNEFKSFEVPYGFSIIDNYDLNDNKSPKQKLYRDIFLKKKLPNPSINYFKSWQDLLFLEEKYDNINLSSVFVKDKVSPIL